MSSKVEGKIESKEVPKELWQIYNVDDFIDAKDNQSDWRVGYIIEKNLITKLYKVRFDGWGAKYDEPYRFTSMKLAPFRSIVIGYTGQKKNPGIRVDWKFTLKTHNEKLQNFKEMCSSQNKTAWEINQFFRGHNYLYTDFLMTQTFQTFEQISAVMEYFLLNVKLVISYLKNLDPEFKQYYRSHEVAEESHLVDPHSAKVNCFYELMDTLYTISGGYARLDGFFSKNAALIRKYLNIDFEKNVRRYYQMRILQEVMKEDGFLILQELIQKKLQNTKCVIPFLFLKSLSSLYIGLGSQIQYKQKKKYLDFLVQITKKNLTKLDDKHLKDINKSHCVDLFETLKSAYENTDDEQVIRNWALEAEVKFYQKMVLCPYFDKKLRGVIGFHELAEKNKMQPYANHFIKILVQEKIFDSLFSVDNAEIIRKAVEFCKFLYYNQMFPTEMAFRIWELREGKHQAALQQIYSLISVLPSKLAHSQFQKKLFEEISKQPKDQWDEDYIKMIKQYSLTAVGWVSGEEKLPEKYGFDILFANVIMKKSEFAINSFIQLLNRFEKTNLMTEFINNCFQKIQANEDSYIYTILLLRIIEQNISQLKETSDKNSGIVIKDLLNNSSDNLERSTKRFELLTQVTKLTNTNVTFEEFMSLWNQFHGKAGLKAFHEWILSRKDGERLSLNIKIGSDIRRQIFEEIWSENYDFTNISEKQALLFVQFFKATNINLKKLKKMNIIIKSQTLDLVGFDKIWRAFENVHDDKIASSLAELIVQVHMSPSSIVEDKKEAWTKQLISLFSKKITEAYKLGNLTKVKRILIIPTKIIDRDEQIFVARPGKSFIMKEYKIVNKSTKEQKFIKFNLGGLTYDFKRTVADKFKVPFKKCKLSCKGEIIKYENYFKSLMECSFSNYPFELEVLEEEAPSIKKLLNSELETFFDLLGDPQLERNVWEIIEKLPIAEDQLKKLQSSEEPWKEINDPSIYKELYRMKAGGFMDRNWWKQFVKGPGLENLSTKFSKVTAKAKVERQYLKSLCESVERCLDIQPSLKQINPQIFILGLLNSLNDLLENSAEESPSKKHSVQVSIVTSIFNIFKKIKNEANFLRVLVQKFEDKIGLLSKGLVTVKNQFIRHQFVLKLKEGALNLTEQSIQSYLKIIYQKIFNLATSYHNEQQTSQYFTYSSQFVDIVEEKEFLKFLKQSDYELTKLVERGLYGQKPELNSESVNYLLVGYLMLMKKLVKFCTPEQRDRITSFLLYKCFFTHLETKNSEPLCKGKQSKTAAFDLLASLLVQNRNSLKAIEILSNLHKEAKWRSKKIDDWTLTPGQKIKSASGYVGLKNLGCICYMNSLFQQIFMIPDFRQAILQCEDPLASKEIPTQNVLYQVKKMFFSLLFSDTKYYMPNQFCHAFKNYQGQPTNVFEQMDIDEFSNVLFDRLETQIKGTAYENIIKDFFGGVFSNQIVCKGCPHFSETQQSFLSVSLNVKGKKNIYQSFDTMIKGDTLDGDNAYFCERCNKKVSAVKRVCLKKLPDHLILTLKRFEFDFETMSKLKLNDYCQFPTQLNVKQYSQQYLRKQENPDRFDQDQTLPDSYYDYTLQGVVIHIGHADSGHYFSYIKQRKNEGRWFQFNDTIVRPFDIKKLAQQAFGGQTGTIEVKQKIKNAYMLIYERKKKLVDNSKLINLNRNLSQIPIYANLKQQIQDQNVIQKIQNIMFSTEYTKFAGNLLKNIDKMQAETAIEAMKYVVQVYLTVIIREKQEISSFEFLKGLNKNLANFSLVREWICTIFTAQKSLREFFKHNPAKEVRKLLAHWVADIVKGVGSEKKFLFIDNIIAFIATSGENFAEFCQILFELMEEKSVVQYAAKKQIVGILLENILGKQKPIFRNIENLTVVESAEKQIGNEVILEKTAADLKKIKYLQETPYVWGVLSKIVQLAESQKKKLSQLISKEEAQLLYLPINKIYKILEQCKCKFIIKKLCKILTFLAKNNQKFTEEIINLGYLGLKQFQSKRYRQFFILLNRLARIEDEFAQFRNKKALENMIRALKDNEKYPFDSSIIQQWIMKSIRKNNQFKLLVLKSPDWHKYLLEVCTKKLPTEDVFRKNSIFTQTTVNKYHGIKLLKSKKAYELLAKKIEKFYEDLSEEKEALDNEWQSDEDLTEQKLQVGQTVAYFDSKDKLQFLEGKVDDILLSRLWISANKVRLPTIWQDDEKLTSKKYPFDDLESEDEIVDSENTTEMEYDDDLNPAI